MPKLSKHIVLILAVLVFSRTMPAQTLPSLPMDHKIQKGTLRCGVTYYMVTNPQTRGYADFAVVRRSEAPAPGLREGLETGFLARSGIGPRPEGYYLEKEGSTLIHFDHVPVYDPAVLDSTLLVTFSQVAASRADEAVIVSGDIDPVELKKKMDIFSMLVPQHYVENSNRPDYVWEPSVMPSVVLKQVPSGDRGTVRVAYASPRTPQDQMNTAQALVMGIFSREFQTVAAHRITRGLREAGVPYGHLELEYINSTETAGDEEYAVTVHTDKDHLEAAMKVVSSTLASLDGFGVGVEEFTDAKRVMMAGMVRRGREMLSNRKYVDRCAAHFLYGANLAPYSEETRLFARKSMADTTETRLFNNFTTSLLSQLENLTLEYRAALDTLDEDNALFQYNLAYLYGSTFRDDRNYAWPKDSVGLEVTCPRVKIKETKAEPVSGGTLWTFSNGVRVVYRQVPGSGMFHYAVLLNGGLSGESGLVEGEGGYFGDMLSLYDAGGFSAASFRDYLAVSGIEMKTEVGMTNMSVQGSAPSQHLPTLLKCLLALSNRRSVNREEFDIYARNEAWKQEERADRLYEKMYPGFTYAPRKYLRSLQPGIQQKAEKYFESRFSRMNDGMIVLVGDLDEGTVRKQLLRYVGGFRTQRGMSARKVVHYQPQQGTITFTEKGADRGVFLRLESEYALTSAHYLTAGMAEEALRRELVAALAGKGWSVSVQCGFLAYPQERFWIQADCRPVPEEGLPDGMKSAGVQEALRAVRAAVRNAAEVKVSARDLSAWKAMVLSGTERDLSAPETIVSSVVARYGIGKDLVTHYKEGISGITAEKVADMVRSVAEGGRVEMIVE